VESSTFYRGVTIIRIFPLPLCRFKIFLLLPNICTCSLQFLTKHDLNVSRMNTRHENKQLSTWSNICWLIHKKHWSWRCFHFCYYPVFHIFRQIWSAPLINIAENRYSSHVGLTSFSKEVHCFQETGFTSVFFSMVWVFYLATSSATSYDASLLGGNIRRDKSLMFQTCFMVWEEFYNFLWRDWDALSLNDVSISKAS